MNSPFDDGEDGEDQQSVAEKRKELRIEAYIEKKSSQRNARSDREQCSKHGLNEKGPSNCVCRFLREVKKREQRE